MVEFPEAVQLARPRSGHFDLGTGYHGDLWLDLDALLLRPALLRAPVRWLAERLREHSAVAACLEEVRGRGAVPVAVAALVSLGEASATVQARMRVPFYPASTVPSRAWPAEQCPLCAEAANCVAPLPAPWPDLRPEVGDVVGEHGGFGAAVDLDDLARDVARGG